ncbi:MAG: hypothetical protein GEU82_07205 [Luteitalea sp.]|nr:hypothetical protein [Luteitalea sp.]
MADRRRRSKSTLRHTGVSASRPFNIPRLGAIECSAGACRPGTPSPVKKDSRHQRGGCSICLPMRTTRNPGLLRSHLEEGAMCQFKKALLCLGVAALASVVDPPLVQGQSVDTIKGCYLRDSGRLRVVKSRRECRRNEVAISWNIGGPQGPVGPVGPIGPVGPPGDPATVVPPLVVTGNLPGATVIAGVNTNSINGSRGVYGQGFSGVVGEGQFGVTGLSSGGTGVSGEGRIAGVTGRAIASASTGGSFLSIGDIGFGVVGISDALTLPGTGVSGVARNVAANNFSLIGTGVKGEGYFGVWGRGRTALTPDGPTGPAVQGAGVRGEGYYGIYGASTTGYAGYFDGEVQVNGGLSATTLLQNSDRNRKRNVAPVDGRDILRRLATLPVQTWSYENEAAGIRHIGPMAQDFYLAFTVGADDRHIATVDEGGVALAAIQSLYRMSQEKDAQIDQLMSDIQALKAEVERLSREK